jgi:phosphatidylglycerophosphate synthase
MGEERREHDLRDTLPELQAVVRSARFKPYAFLVAMALGIRRGLACSRHFPELRASYRRALAVVGLLVAGQFAILLALCPCVLVIGPVVATVIWFAAGGVVVYSQLALVRRPDGTPFTRFGFSNTLTLYRFMNIPFLVSLLPYFPEDRNILTLGTAVFAAAAASDVIDGNYARLTGQVSEFGRIYDPVCDIAINAGVCLGAWSAFYLPGWYVLLAELRFFLPLVGGAYIYAFRKPWRIRPTILGKLSVFVYAIFIALILIRELSREPFLHELSEKFLWLSGILFLFNVVHIIDRGRTLMLTGRRENHRSQP